MRFVSAIGAAVFAYLALIPFTLIASTFDNACTGPGCETPMPIEVLLVVLYVASLLVLAGTALLFAYHAVAGRPETLALEPTALKLCGAVIGVTLFFIFCVLSPIGGAIATVIAILTLQGMHRYNERVERGPPDSGLTNAEFRLRSGPPAGDPNMN